MDAHRNWISIGGGGEVRVGPLMALPTVLGRSGVDPLPLFAAVGIEPERFDDPDTPVTFLAASRLIARGAIATGREDFGLEVGRSAGLDTLGVAGFLVRHSPTVGAALQNLVLHLHVHDRGAVPLLKIEGKFASLGYEIYEPGVEAADQIQDLAIAVAVNILRGLCGHAWKAVEVRLAHRAPTDTAPWRRHFGCSPHFDACESAVSFESCWLDRPVAGADPARLGELQRRVAALEAADRRTLTQRTRAAIRAALAHRDCSARRICQVLSIRYRTLSRRLADEGTTLQRLVDSVRTDVAMRLIAQTDLSLTEIADTLDFADPSAFSRAFVRWTGTPPSRARAGLRGVGTASTAPSTGEPDRHG